MYPKAIEFDAKGLQILRGPGVYMYVQNDRAIYIGSSESVIGRALARNHHKRFDFAKIPGLSLLIFPCDSAQQAYELELKFTARLKPLLNERNLQDINQLAQYLGVSVDQARVLAKQLCQPTQSE